MTIMAQGLRSFENLASTIILKSDEVLGNETPSSPSPRKESLMPCLFLCTSCAKANNLQNKNTLPFYRQGVYLLF